MRRARAIRASGDRSAFAGFRFPPELISLAVRCYLRYGLSYRDVEELLAERGVEVDHVTVYRWVQRFTRLFTDAARPARHSAGDRWFVDETYVKVAGRWWYLYRAVDQFGQVIDVLLCEQRDTAAARRFFASALRQEPAPVEVTTDKAGPYLRVLDELVPAAAHLTEQYRNNRIEADHGRLKARLRPMRGLKRFRSAADRRRPRVRPRPPPRPLRTRHRRPTTPAPPSGVHGTRSRHLAEAPIGGRLARSRPTQQRPFRSRQDIVQDLPQPFGVPWSPIPRALKKEVGDMPEHTLSEPLDATDLMQLGYGDDALLLEDVTLCTLCSHTCCCTAQEQ